MAYRVIPAGGGYGGSGTRFLNFPFGDTTYTKVFVGGLAWETQSETLRLYFEQFGEILEAVVITDKHTDRSKGYGFVTFRDPEAAKRACLDPNPLIDGRRANCNLASLGRPKSFFPYGRVQPSTHYFGSPHTPRGPYVSSPVFQQPFTYLPLHGYPPYISEYVYPQAVYNSYGGQQYLQIYGVPGNIGPSLFPYNQMHPPPPPGTLGYPTIPGTVMAGSQVMQYGRPNFSGATTGLVPAIQTPYQTGQAQVIVTARPPRFTQSNGYDRIAG